MKYTILLVFFSISVSNTFSTALGPCTMQIHNGKIAEIPELITLIQNESNLLVQSLGNIISRPYTIYITESIIEFNNQMQGCIPDWGVAFAKYNPDEIIIKPIDTENISFNHLKKIIKHELNHIYMYRLPYHQTIPSWFKEGIAMKYANQFSMTHKIKISESIWANKMLSLYQLNNFFKYTHNQTKLIYAISAVATDALEYYYGNNIIRVILKNMQNNNNFNFAFNNATSDSIEQFQIKLTEYINNNYKWIILLKSIKYTYTLFPILLIICFLYYNNRKRKIIKKWTIEEQIIDLKND